MTAQDLLNLIDDRNVPGGTLFHRVCARLASRDPELIALFWLLQEGVIGRRRFRRLVTGAVTGPPALPAPAPRPAAPRPAK